jgi:hypothetical protein
LASVHAAYEGTCAELGIGTKSERDHARRAQVAMLINQLADIGKCSALDLQSRAVRLLASMVEQGQQRS